MTQHPSRRDVMIGGAAASLAGVSVGQVAATAATPVTEATGIVTETGRGPLAGVLVSNGREVVRTDEDGRWNLSVAPGQTLFVIKPSGFAAPRDPQTNLAKLFHVHDPDGTPAALGLRYGGLPPTGPLPASFDVALTRQVEPDRFDVILFTDPQPESAAEIAYVRDDAVAPLVGGRQGGDGQSAAFGMTLGDLAFDDLTIYPRLNRMIGQIGVPWWAIGGNHDLDYEAPDAARSRDTWKRVFGAPYYAHAYGGALFVMLDNVDYLGAGSGKPGDKHGAYRGHISDEQLAFVQNLLAATPAETLLVFAMHIPLRTDFDPNLAATNTDNVAALLALIGDRPSVSFAGHTHTCEHHYLGAAYGGSAHPHHHHVLAAVSGSWWSGPLDHRGIACADQTDGTPNGHHVLSVDGTRYTTRFVPAREPDPMRIVLETGLHAEDREVLRTTTMSQALRSPVTADEASAARLVVNLFDGGPRSSVRFAIDGGTPVPMTRVSRPDPFVAQLYGRHPETIKPWVKPSACSHLWEAPLPAGLRAGTYAVRALATDEYGREHERVMVLEVV